MRGSLAKKLRRATLSKLPSDGPTRNYQVMPRTERDRICPVLVKQADGTASVVKATVKTATFQLAPTGVRYFTHKAKRVLKQLSKEAR